MIELKEMISVIDDMKYLNRLNQPLFYGLLFQGNQITHYEERKWELFQTDRLGFLWSCSVDKLEILWNFVAECKEGRRCYE